MRCAMMIVAAIATIGMNVPAEATVFFVSINAVVTGTQFRVACDPTIPSCNVTEPFTKYVQYGIGPIDLAEGPNDFSVGSPVTIGTFAGTIINTGSVLTGINLRYGYQSSSSSNPPVIGFTLQSGTAPTFNVTGGIPEPATWAMMLAGFAIAGTALRRRAGHASGRRSISSGTVHALPGFAP